MSILLSRRDAKRKRLGGGCDEMKALRIEKDKLTDEILHLDDNIITRITKENPPAEMTCNVCGETSDLSIVVLRRDAKRKRLEGICDETNVLQAENDKLTSEVLKLDDQIFDHVKEKAQQQQSQKHNEPKCSNCGETGDLSTLLLRRRGKSKHLDEKMRASQTEREDELTSDLLKYDDRIIDLIKRESQQVEGSHLMKCSNCGESMKKPVVKSTTICMLGGHAEEENENERTLVVLKNGTGKKRQHNGKMAWVSKSKRQKKRGAWAKVELVKETSITDHGIDPTPTNNIIEWRSNAWDIWEKDACTFDNLPDCTLFKISSFLSKSYADGYGYAVQEGQGLSLSSLTFLDAGKFARVIGSISSNLRKRCMDYLRAIPMDVNFYALSPIRLQHKILPGLMWLAREEMKLAQLDVSCAECDSYIIAYLLRSCDTTSMRRCSIIQHKYNGSIVTQTMGFVKNRALFLKVDETGTSSQCSHEEKLLTSLGMPSTNDRKITVTELEDVIVSQCPSLKCLEIAVDIDEASHPAFGLQSLEDLKLHIFSSRERSRKRNRDSPSHQRYLLYSIAKLSRLKRLTLNTSYRYSGGGYSYIRIRSKSLMHIDMTGCVKNLWMEECDCPKLESLACRGSPLGNGVRPCVPREEDLTTRNKKSCFFCPRHNPFSIGDVPCEGMNVPGSCLITFDPDLRKT